MAEYLSPKRVKSCETLAVASALLTTQSYVGQGLVEQYFPVRTQLNPDTDLGSQEMYTLSHLTLKGRGKYALF